ncbi:intradiol ring-cleavage dioxygenase [Methylobacterium nodulans]|uniref:Intradiol ring-cleavage dioxygenase n=1 Tax=Methylobacterium nodulans (strain LMG 21967 / CNCM I-2342 / ORS 2060) TaxID=460265 RepID=B8IF69_METNO|nr:intradiol ring-cleavage dioxygenase [Methylobacterium nodulans]ACL55780.1 intradiol ring-cleavage dioxygenase [Methylobacterium nodulans ORS 2060]
MRDFNASNITQAVIDRMADTPDPRLRTVLSSLVRHLHAFVSEVELSFDEWQGAIGFLTRTGQMCDDHRQEFILLSDTLGVSMLVDAINHHMPPGATETTVLGPFYVKAAPLMPNGSDISGGLTGEPLLVRGSVASADGTPLADATVDVWHADDEGFYDVQRLDKLGNLAGRAQFRTDAAGRFSFWTIMPKWYPIPDDGPVGDMLKATARHPNRPAHMHFMIAADGHETLITHVFSAESPWLDSDAVFGVKTSLIAEFSSHEPGTAPDGREIASTYRCLDYTFGLKPRTADLSVPPRQDPG